MAELVHKVGNAFSDFWLDIELFFGKLFKREKKEKPEIIIKPAEAVEGGSAAADNPRPTAEARQMTEKTIEKEEQKEETKKLPWSLRLLRMSTSARLSFYDQMATLVGSGVTLIDSLSLVQAQTKQKGMKKLFEKMIHEVNTGRSLADAMRMFPHIFPEMQAALVEAGEKSGNMKTVMAELVEEMEAGQEFRRKITGAMFYPIVLIFLALALVVGMMTFVIPKISEMYAEANVALPRLTQAVIDISNFISVYWLQLLLGIVGGFLLLYLFFGKVRIGKLLWEKIISVIPVVGRVAKEKNLMMFASNMSMLMRSGVLISEAFEITEKTVPNLHYQRALSEIRQGVIMGKEVSEMMGLEDIKAQKFKKNKLFPLQVAQLIHIGESTGRIGEMMEKIKKNFHKSIDYTLRNISTIVEPVMIFIVAALVGSILLAVMLPFFYIGTTIS